MNTIVSSVYACVPWPSYCLRVQCLEKYRPMKCRDQQEKLKGVKSGYLPDWEDQLPVSGYKYLLPLLFSSSSSFSLLHPFPSPPPPKSSLVQCHLVTDVWSWILYRVQASWSDQTTLFVGVPSSGSHMKLWQLEFRNTFVA